MIEPRSWVQTASDGYSIHVLTWPAVGTPRGGVVVVHGVQSHAGWYHGLGSRLAEAGFDASFPDRRGSGGNTIDRGHASSPRRLWADLAELLQQLRTGAEGSPTGPQRWALVGISWGAKLAVLLASKRPELVDALALICPGLHPRVDVSPRTRLAIAWARFTQPRKPFAIPLADPALFTASPEGQRFIAEDPLSLRTATASLLATSAFIDAAVRRSPRHLHQPTLLMLAGQDRIVDNIKTLKYMNTLSSTDCKVIEYPEAHHTLEFEPDPAVYARDLIEWLEAKLSSRSKGT